MKTFFLIGIMLAGVFFSLLAPPRPRTAAVAANTNTYQVTSSGDDVNEDGSTFTTNASTVWIGTGGSTSSSYTGLRFANVTIPAGATITSAKVNLYSAQDQFISIRMTIAANLSTNSAVFTASNPPSQRTLTKNQVNSRSNSRWSANTWYTLDEIAPVVQEVVSQTGWSSGASLSIIMKGTGSNWGRKFASSWDGSSSQAPQLIVTYSSGSASTATATSTTAPTATFTQVSLATSTPTGTSTNSPLATATFTPQGPTSTATFTPPASTATATPLSATPTTTTSSGGGTTGISFPINNGSADVISHQLVRASDDRVYFFGNSGDLSTRLLAYWTGSTGLPTQGSNFSGSAQINESSYILAVDAAYDGGQIIHVVESTDDGQIRDRPFDIGTHTFHAAKTIDTSGGSVSGYYSGTSGISAMVDGNKRLNIVYWTAANHILYRAYTYDASTDTLSLAEGPTQIDSNGSANHPALAVNPKDGSITVAWVSQATNPAQILAKTRTTSGWGGVETVSNAPVWTSTNAGVNIDQGPSLIIPADGVRRLTYIENWRSTAPFDYGRIHYVTSSPGSGWNDQYIGSYTHDPAVAYNSNGSIYIIGHGYPLNAACTNTQDMCLFKRNSDGSWATPQVFITHQGNQDFDSSPSVKWSVMGQNRADTIEFFVSEVSGGYANTILYYARIGSSTASVQSPTSVPIPGPTSTPTPIPTPVPVTSGPSGPIQYIQSQLNNSAGFVSTQSVILPQAVASGHTLVVAVSAYSGSGTGDISSVTDSGGDTYTRVVQDPNPAAGGHSLSVWVAQNVAASSSLVITAHAPSGNDEYITLAAHEYSGGSVDQSSHASGTGQQASSGSTATTSQAGELVFGAFLHEAPSDSSPTVIVPANGFTVRQTLLDGTYEPLVSEDENVSQVGAYSSGLFWSTIVPWRAVVVTLKP